jgi:hypothetical protein
VANFPGSLDSLTNPVGTDQTTSATVPHATQHAVLNDIAELVEAKLGIGATTPSVPNTLLAVDTANISLWRQLVLGDITPAALASLVLGNPIINGGLEIWQRGTTFTSIANNAYGPDHWMYGKAGAVVHDLLRSTDVPAIATLVPQAKYSVHLDVTTADASIAAGDACYLRQPIEGYLWEPFAQKQFTVGFWVKDTITGVHCVSARNFGGDRSCVIEYTINVADTWEYKTVTFPASPSAGTWNYDTEVGLVLNWVLSIGSTYQTTPGTWQTGSFFGTANQVNATNSTANNFKLWGVTMGLGSAVAPYWPRPFSEELRRCLRYYWKTFPYATAPAQNSGTAIGVINCVTQQAGGGVFGVHVSHPVPMRVAPSIVTFYNPSATNANVRNLTDNTDSGTATAVYTSDIATGVSFQHTAGDAINRQMGVHMTASAEL